MNVKTKTLGELELVESWENTVERIFARNEDDLLLEFTATHDYETPAMIENTATRCSSVTTCSNSATTATQRIS